MSLPPLSHPQNLKHPRNSFHNGDFHSARASGNQASEPSFERMRPAAPSIPAAQPVARGPNFASQIYSEAKKKDPRRLADLEERLGANWLNKIGTAAFVIGVALLLNYSMHYLGPSREDRAGLRAERGVAGDRSNRRAERALSHRGAGGAWGRLGARVLHDVRAAQHRAVRLVASPRRLYIH